jgi:hypothetical protein
MFQGKRVAPVDQRLLGQGFQETAQVQLAKRIDQGANQHLTIKTRKFLT